MEMIEDLRARIVQMENQLRSVQSLNEIYEKSLNKIILSEYWSCGSTEE